MENSPPPEKLFFSLKYVIGPSILLACVLGLRWPVWSRLLFFAWYINHLLQGIGIRTGDTWLDYSNGSTLGGDIFKTLYLLFLVDPVLDWRHRSDGETKIVDRPRWQRIYWCLCASFTLRGVGWNYQVPGVPSPSRMNQSLFLCCTVGRVVSSYLLLDIVQCSMQAIPFFSEPLPNATVRSYSYLHQVLYMVLCFAVPYGALRFHYYLAALGAVIFGYSSQEDWPDFFGSWFDAYSVRNLWGKTWHQMLRRHCVSIGKAIAKLLGAPKRTLVSLIIELHVAFLISAIMHSFGDYTLGWQHIGMSLPFFIMQPSAIVFEILFTYATNEHRYTRSIPLSVKRFIGYTWTLAWFTYSAAWYIDPFAQIGFGKIDIVPFSVIRFVAGHLHH
ncbi:hypothetical protein BT96DRAFT_825753 [Gymnopus androsaceus JB14]|uniref:Wax synthase domain-containing protein n=1 Tax=Gymnopus androsaceus JB14 TaxID=1447944 RepID=A0A6A4HFJ6_9AGAR|nr:hypothetical protein BT96DRAFT_825753 [Gymnopus androsaceus JB14]